MKVPGRTAVALTVLCMAAVLPRVWAQMGGGAGRQTPTRDQEAAPPQIAIGAPAASPPGPPDGVEFVLRGVMPQTWPAEGPSPQVIVLPTRAMDESQAEALAIDLGVMSRVLEKALRATMGEGEVPERSGMFTPLLGSPERQGIYLGGYGAVFITSVRFPLAGPQEPQEQKPAEQPRSLWDETKREMEGASPMGVGGFSGGPAGGAVMGIGGPAASPWPRYDPARVENLKTALIETLREASHIREMAGDDSVTVIVWGPPEAEAMTGGTFYAEPGTPGGSAVISVLARTNAVTVIDEKGKVVSVRRTAAAALTIQAKKADIDAFAAGKLTLDEFRKRATVAIR